MELHNVTNLNIRSFLGCNIKSGVPFQVQYSRVLLSDDAFGHLNRC